MKILFVIETLGRGGAEILLLNTVKNLTQQGIQAEVVVLFDRNELQEEVSKYNIKTHELKLKNKWFFRANKKKLQKVISNVNPDIIHAHLLYATLYVAYLKYLKKITITTVATFHNLLYNTMPKRKPSVIIIKFLNYLSVKNFNGFTAISSAVKEHYQKELKIKKSNIKIIHNSVEISKKTTCEDYEKIKLLKKECHTLIITPGRLVHEKGHKYLLEAIEKEQLYYNDNKVLFVIIGSGPEQDRLTEMVKTSNIKNVKFFLATKHGCLMNIVSLADIVVVPSVHEGFGLVVAEAMMLRKPVIATRTGGIVDIIDHGENGMLIDSKNSIAINKALRLLIEDTNLQKKISEEAYEKTKRFTADSITKQWVDYYQKLIEK